MSERDQGHRDQARTTYLLIDGENIDATLGNSILGRRPHPEERPRWDRLLSFARAQWGQEVRALFFLNATSGLPMSFVQALTAMGYEAIPLSGPPEAKVVDIAIDRTLGAIAARPDADLLLASHDGDFLAGIEALLDGERQVGIIGFTEFRNAGFAALEGQGLLTFDLEYAVGAFTARLPRIRVIPIEEFDPLVYL